MFHQNMLSGGVALCDHFNTLVLSFICIKLWWYLVYFLARILFTWNALSSSHLFISFETKRSLWKTHAGHSRSGSPVWGSWAGVSCPSNTPWQSVGTREEKPRLCGYINIEYLASMGTDSLCSCVNVLDSMRGRTQESRGHLPSILFT